MAHDLASFGVSCGREPVGVCLLEMKGSGMGVPLRVLCGRSPVP